VFQITKADVVIVRILYGGREYASFILGSADE
jgi:hypothetical protein